MSTVWILGLCICALSVFGRQLIALFVGFVLPLMPFAFIGLKDDYFCPAVIAVHLIIAYAAWWTMSTVWKDYKEMRNTV